MTFSWEANRLRTFLRCRVYDLIYEIISHIRLLGAVVTRWSRSSWLVICTVICIFFMDRHVRIYIDGSHTLYTSADVDINKTFREYLNANILNICWQASGMYDDVDDQ